MSEDAPEVPFGELVDEDILRDAMAEGGLTPELETRLERLLFQARDRGARGDPLHLLHSGRCGGKLGPSGRASRVRAHRPRHGRGGCRQRKAPAGAGLCRNDFGPDPAPLASRWQPTPAATWR